MRKKVLITGITGMVGSHLADYLLENTDWHIYGLCRWRSPMNNVSHLIPWVNNNDRIFFLYGDLNDSVSLQKAIDFSEPDYIFHLGAQSFPRTSFDSPIDTLNTNILGTARLLEVVKYWIEKKGTNPIIHICSSSEVFGRIPKDRLPIKEDESFHPASPYAISKSGTDLLGRYYGEAFGMTTLTTRMFTHTGPRRGDVFAESSFAKQIAMIEAGIIKPCVKVGNLNSLRTFTDVRDAVRAYYMLVTVNPVPGAYYNIGGNYTCTIGNMLNYLLSLSHNKNIEIRSDPNRVRPVDADLQVPDVSKFEKHTGWKPRITFEKTMKDLLNYWRKLIKEERNFIQR